MNPEKIKVGNILLTRTGKNQYEFQESAHALYVKRRRWGSGGAQDSVEMPWEVTLWVRDAGHGYVEFAKNLGHQSLRKAIKACSSRLARDAIAYETAMQAINKVA